MICEKRAPVILETGSRLIAMNDQGQELWVISICKMAPSFEDGTLVPIITF